jgi:cytochrome P450
MFRPFWANSVLEETAESWMLFKDPPDHTRLRRIAARAFTPKAAASIQARIERAADDLIEALRQRSEVEFIGDFAGPFPIRVVASIMGLPDEDCAQLRMWSHALTAVFEPGALKHATRCTANHAASELRSYFRDHLTWRRRVGKDDLICWLMEAQDGADRLEEREMIGLLILLLVAGHETATNLLGNGLFALLQHPTELCRLRRYTDLWSTAVEELLRYDCPVAIDSLVALEDVVVDGRRIDAGELVLLMLAGANRDPAVFMLPDALDLGRHPNPHVAFGMGPHYCLGAVLARLEGQIGLSKVLGCWKEIEVDMSRVQRGEFANLRGFERLPLQVKH